RSLEQYRSALAWSWLGTARPFYSAVHSKPWSDRQFGLRGHEMTLGIHHAWCTRCDFPTFCGLRALRYQSAARAVDKGQSMKQSTDRILTTHVGSLIRPAPLQEFLRAKQAGKAYDQSAYEACLTTSGTDVVRKQGEVGVDVVSDGEFGKSISWSQYVLERLSGFERRPIKPGGNPFTRGVDRERFAEFYAELDAREGVA